MQFIILIPQLFFWFFANPFSVCEEIAFTWPFRNILFKSDPISDVEEKRKLLKTAHSNGWKGVAAVGIGMGATAAAYQPTVLMAFITGLVITLNCMLIYSWRFDTGFARQIGKVWWYLGEFASTDIWWLKRFGSQGGKVKVYICAGIVVLLNGLYFIFYPSLV